ncbi:MAG: hypothetical protein Q9191_004721 [Dirinaria sp. TL-2023a]
MEANKIRSSFHEAANKLLLPLSFGVSSVSLLHVLDQHLQFQIDRTGHTTYTLHVLIIDEKAVTCRETCDALLPNLRQRFPLHTYSIIPIEEVFNYDELCLTQISEDFRHLGENPSFSRRDTLTSILSSLPSASSRVDISNILRTRLISAFAERQQCYGVIFGDTTTRLAQKTIAETAKGRGGSLPWLTADGIMRSGLKVIYPMRDILKKEVLMYAETVEPPLDSSVLLQESASYEPPSSKNITIDDLMGQYFESVEHNYPSIVANVVRTSGRLLPLPLSKSSELCLLCGHPMEKSHHAWAGEQEASTIAINETTSISNGKTILCYGCERATRSK